MYVKAFMYVSTLFRYGMGLGMELIKVQSVLACIVNAAGIVNQAKMSLVDKSHHF